MDFIVLADLGPTSYIGVRHQACATRNLNRTFDHHIRANFNVRVDLCFRIDDGSGVNAHGVRSFSVGIIVIVLVLYAMFAIATRNLVPLLSPRSKVDEPAALGAEGTIGVILPAYFSMTGRTLDRFGHGGLLQEGRLPVANSCSTSSFFCINPWSRE